MEQRNNRLHADLIDAMGETARRIEHIIDIFVKRVPECNIPRKEALAIALAASFKQSTEEAVKLALKQEKEGRIQHDGNDPRE